MLAVSQPVKNDRIFYITFFNNYLHHCKEKVAGCNLRYDKCHFMNSPVPPSCRFSNNIQSIFLKLAEGANFDILFEGLKSVRWSTKQETMNSSNGENMTDTIRKVLVINCAVNFPLALTTTIGNILVLNAVWKTPALRSSSMVLFCGLAMSDLTVGVIVQPLFIANDLIGLYSQSRRLKQLFWNVYNVFGFSLCGISLCTVTAISVDRLIAVQKSLHYPSLVTIPRVKRILVAIWIICVILTSTQFWQQTIQLIALGIVICVCLGISTISHVKIYKNIRYHQNVIQLQLLAVEANSGNISNTSPLKMSTFNALIVFLVLIICYFPYLVVFVVTSINPTHVFIGRSLTSTIVFINSCLNPFLYCWRLCEVREAVKQTCRKLVCCK